jgi:hypothetical protein
VDWNTSFEYGIERIDGMKLMDGSLLLVEIEDCMAYLSLREISAPTRDFVIERLMASMRKNFFGK